MPTKGVLLLRVSLAPYSCWLVGGVCVISSCLTDIYFTHLVSGRDYLNLVYVIVACCCISKPVGMLRVYNCNASVGVVFTGPLKALFWTVSSL